MASLGPADSGTRPARKSYNRQGQANFHPSAFGLTPCLSEWRTGRFLGDLAAEVLDSLALAQGLGVARESGPQVLLRSLVPVQGLQSLGVHLELKHLNVRFGSIASD